VIHELKTWPEPFEALLSGKKMHEIRSCLDRTFTEGDELVLREWKPAHEGPCKWDDDRCTFCGREGDEPLPGEFTGRQATREVTYVSGPGKWGLGNDTVVLSVQEKDRKWVRARLIYCTECNAEYREPYEGQSENHGWVSYYESDNNRRRRSPLIQLCPGCAEKPFKRRYG
jgi:hypothetical protein